MGSQDHYGRLQAGIHRPSDGISSYSAYSASKSRNEAGSSVKGSGRAPGEGCGIPVASRSRPAGVFRHLLLGSEEDGRLAADNKSSSTESVHQAEEVSYGDFGVHPQVEHQRFLGHIYRPEGCVPPYSHTPVASQMATVQRPGTGLCFPVLAFRTFYGPTGVYPGSYGGGRISSSPRSSYLHVPRRLAGAVSFGGGSKRAYAASLADRGASRFHSEQSQIPSDSDAETVVSRGRTRLGARYCDSLIGEGEQVDFRSNIADRLNGSMRSGVDEVLRSDGQHGRDCTLVPAAHEACSAPSGGFLSPGDAGSADLCPGGSRGPYASTMVDSSIESDERGHISTSIASGNAHYGCLINRLGGSRRSSNDKRPVVSGSVSDAHQRPGVACSGKIVAGPICESRRETRTGQVGQRDYRSVHQQAGRNALADSMFSSDGPTSLVSGQCHSAIGNAHSRCRQSDCGQSIAGTVGTPDGVVVGATGDISSLPAIGPPVNRPVRDETQQAAPGVLHSHLRRGRIRSRCPVNRLDGDGRLRLPTNSIASESFGEDLTGAVCDHSDRAILAEEAVVSPPSQSTRRHTTTSTVAPRPSENARQQGSISRRQRSQVSSVAAIRRRYIKAGFSRTAANFVSAGRRQSTLQVYTARLRPFYAWCKQRGVDPTRASVSKVADFLCFIYRKNVQASTVRGYLSAILSIHEGTPEGLSLRHDNSLKLLIEGFHNSNPPPRKIWPSWDLEKVLDSLNSVPYEPALAATLRNWTVKTVFLLALASGRRSSELHALAIGEHIVWHSKGGVSLHFRPSFLAKNERSTFVAKPIALPKLGAEAGERRLSCPVRALKWYLKKSELVRGGINQLFVTTNNPVRPAAKTTVAGWVVEAIVKAQALSGEGRPRAHSVRAEATSTAFHRGLAIHDVIDTVSWKSDHVFISTYLKDRPPESASKRFARTVLSQSS